MKRFRLAISLILALATFPAAGRAVTEEPIRPVLGVSTNLPYDVTYIPHYGLTSIPSLTLEYYPGKGKFTFGADAEWPMWKHPGEHRYLQVNNITVWSRYYFKPRENRFRGWYLLASVNASRYGIGWEGRGWQGEGLGVSLGIGYKFTVGRFFMDMGLAAGYFYSGYDPYVWGADATGYYYYDFTGEPEQFVKRNSRLSWIGPTRVYLSIGVDLFNRKKKR